VIIQLLNHLKLSNLHVNVKPVPVVFKAKVKNTNSLKCETIFGDIGWISSTSVFGTCI